MGSKWLGPLCEALEWPDRQVSGAAARLLTEMLPRVREDDAAGITAEHRTCLYRRLTLFAALKEPELALAILQALPFVGDEAALPYVERLAVVPAITREGRRVRRAARAALPMLERHVALDRRVAATEAAARQAESAPLLTIDPGAPLTERERAEAATADALVDRQMAEIEASMRKLQRPGMRATYLIASWVVIVPYFALQALFQFREGAWLLGLLSAVMAVLTSQLYRLTLSQEHVRIARILAKVDDVRCVGRLAEALEWPDDSVKAGAAAGLTRLLPRVKASDRVLTQPHQRASLHRMLILTNARRDANLMLAILQALQQVGDSSSLPFVQALASARPASARQRADCDAARDCLEYLRVRAELNRSSQTLLRASSSTSAGAETLVRAADARATTDPIELLRADQGHSA